MFSVLISEESFGHTDISMNIKCVLGKLNYHQGENSILVQTLAVEHWIAKKGRVCFTKIS